MKVILLLSLIGLLQGSLNAQIKIDIICRGSPAGRTHPVCSNHTLEFKDSANINQFLSGLISELHNNSYLEASIDSLVRHKDRIKAYLHTGNKYEYISISDDLPDEEIIEMLDLKPSYFTNRIISAASFRRMQTEIIAHLEDNGYPFASAGLRDIRIMGDTISGKLVIDKSRKYSFDNIYLYGNHSIKPEYLYRLIGIKPGDSYSEKKFMTTGELIRETPFLSQIREAEIEFTDRSADLYLYLNNRQASQFSGILGISPGNEEGRAKLAGELNLNLVNVFRRMENIILQWQNPGNNIQMIYLRAGQPYLFARPFGFDISFSMFRQDSTYMRTEAEAGVPINIHGRGSVRIFAKTTGSSIIGDIQPADRIPAADVSGNIIGISYRISQIDNRINPYRGWLLDFSGGAGSKRVSSSTGYGYDNENTLFSEFLNRFGLFIPVSAKSTIHISNLAGIKHNFTKDKRKNVFFANELFLLGGLESIRGFDEKSIAASAYSIQRIEYRYLFEQAGNIFIFFDQMIYTAKLPVEDISDMPFGFGGGLTFETRAGQFILSYGIGREHGNPLLFRTSRIHMGIINRF